MLSFAFQSSSPEMRPQDASWAVIAFAPDDFAWFDWVHQQLEGFNVPPNLVGQIIRPGVALPQKLALFPDPWTPFNAEDYSAALTEAECLIVLCSPNSSQLTWVKEQIRQFKRTGGEERIIAVVVDGPPGVASERSSAESLDWLPSWISWRLQSDGSFRPAEPSEPQIIDARRHRSGSDQIRKELVAALMGVHVEMLEQMATSAANTAAAQSSSLPAGAAPALYVVPDPPKLAPVWGMRLAAIAMVAAAVACVMMGLSEKGDANQPMTPKARIYSPAVVENVAQKQNPMPVVSTPIADQTAPPAPAPAVTASEPMIVSQPAGGPSMVISPGTFSRPTVASSVSPVVPAQPVEQPRPPISPLGDTLMAGGNLESALVAYEKALSHIRESVGLPGGINAGPVEVAQLCLSVGVLQAEFRSTVQAQRTLELGRMVLVQATDKERLAQIIALSREEPNPTDMVRNGFELARRELLRAGGKGGLDEQKARCLINLETSLRRIRTQGN